VIEVHGRERTIARRLVRGIVFGPARQVTPSPGRTQPSAAVAARSAALPPDSEGDLYGSASGTGRGGDADARIDRGEPPPAVSGACQPSRRSRPSPRQNPRQRRTARPGPAPPQPAMPVEPPPALPSARPRRPPQPPGLRNRRPGSGTTRRLQIGPRPPRHRVWNNTAMSRAVPVRPDGRSRSPLSTTCRRGLTPMQLREVLVGKLTAYIRARGVGDRREVHSFKVSVIAR